MDETRILMPYEDVPDDFSDLRKKLKDLRDKLDLELPNQQQDSNNTGNLDIMNNQLTFNDFLAKIGYSKDEYIRIIRTSIQKELPCEIWINPYNEKIIRLQKSNIDIQFVLDAYACCCYIIDYINKGDSGMSGLMKKILEEVRTGNLGLTSILRKVGTAFHQNSELSAQESAYNVQVTNHKDQHMKMLSYFLNK